MVRSLGGNKPRPSFIYFASRRDALFWVKVAHREKERRAHSKAYQTKVSFERNVKA